MIPEENIQIYGIPTYPFSYPDISWIFPRKEKEKISEKYHIRERRYQTRLQTCLELIRGSENADYMIVEFEDYDTYVRWGNREHQWEMSTTFHGMFLDSDLPIIASGIVEAWNRSIKDKLTKINVI